MSNLIRITSDGTPGNTRVLVDGYPLTSCRRVAVVFDAHEPTMVDVTLRMYVDRVDIDGQAEVDIRKVAPMTDAEAIERALSKLGELGMRGVIDRLIEALAEEARRG